MIKYKVLLIFMVICISSIFTLITMYFFGSWQHDRYWNGTIVRVNEIESSVYIGLLSTDINAVYAKRDFESLRQVFKPLAGKMFITITDKNGNSIFNNEKYNRELGVLLQETQVESDIDKFTIKIYSYSPPSWNSVYLGWLSNFSKWFSIRYDRITIPTIFYFLIWSLFFTAAIWRHKANIENDRLFHVLREFEANTDEKELE